MVDNQDRLVCTKSRRYLKLSLHNSLIFCLHSPFNQSIVYAGWNAVRHLGGRKQFHYDNRAPFVGQYSKLQYSSIWIVLPVLQV